MRSKSLVVLVAVLCVVALSGCNMSRETIFDRYYSTSLNVSTSADIIPMIQAKGETLTKGENAIASWGDEKNGSVVWFNAIAFDDESSKAVRKYGFVATPKRRFQRMRLDAELVIDPDVLDEPHANENARKIAILKSILDDFNSDMAPLVKDSKALNSATLMAMQLLKKLITDLEVSPALATNLGNYGGMDFNNMNLGKGKTRMIIVDGIVNLKSISGAPLKDFDKRLQVKGM
jgi:hypothetical protein